MCFMCDHTATYDYRSPDGGSRVILALCPDCREIIDPGHGFTTPQDHLESRSTGSGPAIYGPYGPYGP